MDLKQAQKTIGEVIPTGGGEVIGKSSVGFAGAITAMTINDWAGLVVAVLTAIYMLFQIEKIWQERKERKKNDTRD